MNEIIIDSNLLLGLIDEKDKWHPQALAIKLEIQNRKWSIIYLDCIITETVSVLARRLEEKKRAHEFPALLAKIRELIPEEQITWIYPEIKQSFVEAMELMATHQGRLNFHDALIVLTARKMGICYIASFDRDFDEIDWLTRFQHKDDFEKKEEQLCQTH